MNLQQSNYYHIEIYNNQLPLAQLVWLEGDGNYTRIHIQKAWPVMTPKTLTRWQEQLPTFIRVSKGALINPLHIADIMDLSSKELWIILTDGTKLSVPRRRVALLRHYLEKMIKPS